MHFSHLFFVVVLKRKPTMTTVQNVFFSFSKTKNEHPAFFVNSTSPAMITSFIDFNSALQIKIVRKGLSHHCYVQFFYKRKQVSNRTSKMYGRQCIGPMSVRTSYIHTSFQPQLPKTKQSCYGVVVRNDQDHVNVCSSIDDQFHVRKVAFVIG